MKLNRNVPLRGIADTTKRVSAPPAGGTMRTFVIAALLACALATPFGACGGSPSHGISVSLAVAPVYPPIAITANTSGDVEVVATLDKAGNVAETRVVAGHPLLQRAAIDAAKRWRFQAGADGKRVHLFFSFRMVAKGTPAEEMTPAFAPPYHVEVRGKLPQPTVNYERGR